MSEKTAQPTKVVTGLVRLSYCHLFEPSAVNEGEDKKYSVKVIIPKKDKATLDKVNKAIDASIQVGKAEKFGGKTTGLKLPLRDGDDEEDESLKDSFFINCNSKSKPQVVDKYRNLILDADEIYSGCYGHVSINFYPFNGKQKGIAAGLGNVMKVKDGERLGGGRSTAESDFAEIEIGEDDDLMG